MEKVFNKKQYKAKVTKLTSFLSLLIPAFKLDSFSQSLKPQMALSNFVFPSLTKNEEKLVLNACVSDLESCAFLKNNLAIHP